MQYNIINNCHILAAANTTYWPRPILTSIGPVGKGDQIRSVVTMTTSTIADRQFYSIFWTVQRHVCVRLRFRTSYYVVYFISVKHLNFVVLVGQCLMSHIAPQAAG